MALVTITGTVKRADGSAWANARVEIRVDGSVDPTPAVAVADGDGVFSHEIYTNASSVVAAIATLPDGSAFCFDLDPDSDEVDLRTLQSIGGEPVTVIEDLGRAGSLPSDLSELPAADSVVGSDLVAIRNGGESQVWKCVNPSGVGAGKSVTLGGLTGQGGTDFVAEDNAAFWEWVNDNKASSPAVSVGAMDGDVIFAITIEPNTSVVMSHANNPGVLFAQDILIAGAGSDEVNGTLPVSGIAGGRPKFGRSGATTYVNWVSSTHWRIEAASGDRRYHSFDNVATPDLCTTWVQGNEPGDLPVPTVTATPVASPPETVKATIAQIRRSDVVTKAADFEITAADAGVTFDVTTDLTVTFNSNIPVGFVCHFYSGALVYIDTDGGEIAGIASGPFPVGVLSSVPNYCSLIKISDTRWAVNTGIGEP